VLEDLPEPTAVRLAGNYERLIASFALKYVVATIQAHTMFLFRRPVTFDTAVKQQRSNGCLEGVITGRCGCKGRADGGEKNAGEDCGGKAKHWELGVGSGKWEWEVGVGSWKWEVGSGSGKWEWEVGVGVGSGKWEVGSGKWEVGSGKWEVRSEK
jgi:hypothetical protein